MGELSHILNMTSAAINFPKINLSHVEQMESDSGEAPTIGNLTERDTIFNLDNGPR